MTGPAAGTLAGAPASPAGPGWGARGVFVAYGKTPALEDIWLPAPGAKERFDAYRKLSRSHSESAYDRATGRARAHEENDAIDLNLLHHLAEGEIILVTRDCRLVESVDKCGTVQAPWVRTVGEVLSGQIPTGPSFGENARRETDRHRPRRRKDLQQLDAEQEKRLKDEGGSLAEAVRP